jgi:hypothetical protein
MAALLILVLIYAGVILAYILVSRHNARVGEASSNSFYLLDLGGGAEPKHKADRHTRQLTEEEWNGFNGVWQSIRARFDDDPKVAVVYADLVISDLVVNNTERAARPGDCNLKDKYRVAHELIRSGHTGTVNAEELRQAMGLYAALFDELVPDRPPAILSESPQDRATGEGDDSDWLANGSASEPQFDSR